MKIKKAVSSLSKDETARGTTLILYNQFYYKALLTALTGLPALLYFIVQEKCSKATF